MQTVLCSERKQRSETEAGLGVGLLSRGGREGKTLREEGGAPEAAQTPGQNPRMACAETLQWEELGRAVKAG